MCITWRLECSGAQLIDVHRGSVCGLESCPYVAVRWSTEVLRRHRQRLASAQRGALTAAALCLCMARHPASIAIDVDCNRRCCPYLAVRWSRWWYFDATGNALCMCIARCIDSSGAVLAWRAVQASTAIRVDCNRSCCPYIAVRWLAVVLRCHRQCPVHVHSALHRQQRRCACAWRAVRLRLQSVSRTWRCGG